MSIAPRSAAEAVGKVVSATIAVSVLATGVANAGTYEVSTCRAPDGSASVTADEFGGWRSSSSNLDVAGGNVVADDCASGGALTTRRAFSRSQPTPSVIDWSFFAPDATAIVGYGIDFDGGAKVGTPGDPVVGEVTDLPIGKGPGLLRAVLRDWSGGPHTLGRPIEAARYVTVRTGCNDGTGASRPCQPQADGAPARINTYRGTFTLEDREAPAVTAVSGDATTDSLWAGSTGISVGATGQGGGAYRLRVEADRQVRSRQYLVGPGFRSW